MILPLYFIHYRTRVPSRARSLRIEARGIFLGAEVVRGHDWRWGNQDGKWLCWSLFPFTPHALKVPLVQHLFQCSRIYIQRLIYDVLSLALVISFMQGGVDLGGTWGPSPYFQSESAQIVVVCHTFSHTLNTVPLSTDVLET